MLTPPSDPNDLLRDIRGERLSHGPTIPTSFPSDPDIADILSHMTGDTRGIFITYQPGDDNRGVLRYLVFNAAVPWASRVLIDVLQRINNGSPLE